MENPEEVLYIAVSNGDTEKSKQLMFGGRLL